MQCRYSHKKRKTNIQTCIFNNPISEYTVQDEQSGAQGFKLHSLDDAKSIPSLKISQEKKWPPG